MIKIPVVISAPIDTYSGYGARARDFIKAVIAAKPDWDVRILSQRWGNTKFGYLKDHNEDDLSSRILSKLTYKPKVWMQITVPNEFQAIGEYNIGVTASIETTVCDATWVEGVNRMDLTITSAKHGKTVFENSQFDVQDKAGKQIKQVKLSKPVEVLFEGVDLNTYRQVEVSGDEQIIKNLNSIDESFCFLFVGHWLQGELGQDRKNVGLMIERFLTTFKGKKNQPALILKTQTANSSVSDQTKILDKIDKIKKQVGNVNLPSIYFIHGELSDAEINMLYHHSKVKAMVSLTKGEGFGRPLLEFSITGKPIIASAWSGHTDFLDVNLSTLIGGKLTNVHPSAVIEKMILADSKWFEADPGQASAGYKYVFKEYKKALKNSKRQGAVNKRKFSFEKMQETLTTIFDNNLPNLAVEVAFKPPVPKKILMPKKTK